ncbi:unnamed protein product [Rhodiola kirilowii]
MRVLNRLLAHMIIFASKHLVLYRMKPVFANRFYMWREMYFVCHVGPNNTIQVQSLANRFERNRFLSKMSQTGYPNRFS